VHDGQLCAGGLPGANSYGNGSDEGHHVIYPSIHPSIYLSIYLSICGGFEVGVWTGFMIETVIPDVVIWTCEIGCCHSVDSIGVTRIIPQVFRADRELGGTSARCGDCDAVPFI
jgi:hypothetical protein